MDAAAISIRPLGDSDSLAALTELLHRAYASLAAMGLDYTATNQGIEVTARRVAAGQCYVAALDGVHRRHRDRVGPYDAGREPGRCRRQWFVRPDAAHFHQLGVEPGLQGKDIGQRLIARCKHGRSSTIDRGRVQIMRTSIVIDDALMEAAMKTGRFKTKKDAVEAGLRLLALQAAYREILRWRGKLRWDGEADAIAPEAAPQTRRAAKRSSHRQ